MHNRRYDYLSRDRRGWRRVVLCIWLLGCAAAVAVGASAGNDSDNSGANNAASDESIQRMARALRIATVSYQDPAQIDYTEFDAFMAFMRSSYPRVFATLKVEIIANYSVLLRWPGSNASLQPVLFDAHYDVVPIEPGTLQAWQHPPFAGTVDAGYLWGRGAIDDKFAVIAYLEALEGLLESGYTPVRSLYFSIVHDEEIGGNNGAAKVAQVLRSRGVRFAYMIGEGGMVLHEAPLLGGKTMAMIALAEKTYVTLTLTSSGAGGHASMPPRDNAAARIARAAAKIHDNPLPAQLLPPVTSMLEAMGPYIGGASGWLMRNQWLGGALIKRQMASDRANNAMVRTTAAVTMLQSGVKENVVPQHASATVNLRLLPGVVVDQTVAAIEHLVDDPSVHIAVDSWGQAPKVAAIDAMGYRRISRAIARVFPDAAVIPGLLVASTDTRHYQRLTDNIYRFRAYRIPLADAASIHSTNERLAVASFLTAIEFSGQLIREAAAPE